MALSMNSVTLKGMSMGILPPTTFRFFRLNVQSWTGDACRVQALRAMVGSTQYPVDAGPFMTSNTTPSPLVASASSELSGSFQAWNAFASASGSGSLLRWISSGSDLTPWLQFDMGAGNEISPTAVQICPDGDSGSIRYIQNFTFSGSNTGAFSGEETLFYTSASLNSSFWTASTPVTFTF
jgi:hypothetical protein